MPQSRETDPLAGRRVRGRPGKVRWDQLVTVGTLFQFEQTRHHDPRTSLPNWMRRGMQKQKTFKNYLEPLAKERSETERLFFLRVLARKAAENRRRSTAGRRAGSLAHRRPVGKITDAAPAACETVRADGYSAERYCSCAGSKATRMLGR